MSNLHIKWTLMCKILKPLSHSERLKLFAFLDDEAKSIDQLALKSKMCQTAVSRHLRSLQNGGLVNRSKQGQQVYYSVDRCVGNLSDELEKTAVCISKNQIGS